MDGILGVDKARGPTSHDVVQEVRRRLSLRQVGHAGTLDPDASGVLLVCVGRATKISRYLMDGEKEYHATLRLGFRTQTGDRTGEISETPRPVRVSPEQVRESCSRWVGEVEQIPPMVSALKRGGVRLYKLAREGIQVDRTPRRVQIHEIEVLDVLLPFVRLRVRCGSGTYIRVLAEDIGESLGCSAHVFTLRRSRVGTVGLDQCLRWDEIRSETREGRIPSSLLSMDRALDFLPGLTMTEQDSRRIRTGMPIQVESRGAVLGEARWLRLRDPAGDLVAIGTVSGEVADHGVTIRSARVLSPAG
jgi:tRNA pseudouridine55 synthase